MQVTGRCRRWMTAITLALVVGGYASRAEAAINLVEKDGWSANFDGFLNMFLVDTFGEAPPPGVFDVWSAPTDDNTFRLRTGFLPSALGFNAAAPEWEGIKVKLRIGVYVQVNSNGTRTTPTATYINSPLIDWREFNITVSGKFGELLVGRALNLYQADAVLSDISLFGVGIPGQLNSSANVNGWPTLGHIGFGYLYPAFGAQLRYTTPAFGGFKLAVALGDPSQIVGGYGTVVANVTTLPDLEATLSWATKSDGVSLKAWLGGLVNKATFQNKVAAPGNPAGSVTGQGGAAGLNLGFGGLDVVASGFYAEGLGTYQQLDGIDSLDATGAPVTSKGFLLQAAYKAGNTKLGANYGQVMADRTAAQEAANASVIENRQSITFGVYHDLNAWLKLVAEYSWYQLNWYGGASQSGNVATLGGFFFF